MLISIFTLLAAELVMYFQYGSLINGITLLKVLVIILVIVFSNSAMMYLLIFFIHSSSAYSVTSSLVGSLSGFIAGVYIPVGLLPAWVSSMIKFFPAS